MDIDHICVACGRDGTGGCVILSDAPVPEEFRSSMRWGGPRPHEGDVVCFRCYGDEIRAGRLVDTAGRITAEYLAAAREQFERTGVA